jgi:hypothetical protein
MSGEHVREIKHLTFVTTTYMNAICLGQLFEVLSILLKGMSHARNAQSRPAFPQTRS